MKYILGIILGLALGAAIPFAFGATAFTHSILNVTGSVPTKSFERYENDEAICYVFSGKMSCLKK